MVTAGGMFCRCSSRARLPDRVRKHPGIAVIVISGLSLVCVPTVHAVVERTDAGRTVPGAQRALGAASARRKGSHSHRHRTHSGRGHRSHSPRTGDYVYELGVTGNNREGSSVTAVCSGTNSVIPGTLLDPESLNTVSMFSNPKTYEKPFNVYMDANAKLIVSGPMRAKCTASVR
jgi:hypothetical protein